jgi:hypothetical protein
LKKGEILEYQDKIMDKQDQNLGKISDSLDRIKNLGHTIGDEIDEGSKLLGKKKIIFF